MKDVRICAIGDSFVAGVGDPEHRGWVGRLAAATHSGGLPLTLYNLGVRRETSRDVLARWRHEIAPRLRGPDPVQGRVVVSFGANDTAVETGGRTRVAPAESAVDLEILLEGLAQEGWPALVVGPPPVADPEHAARIVELSARFAEVCGAAGAAWVPVADHLRDDEMWRAEVQAGDGAHPGAAGYERLTGLVAPHWDDWLSRCGPES